MWMFVSRPFEEMAIGAGTAAPTWNTECMLKKMQFRDNNVTVGQAELEDRQIPDK